MQLKLIFCITRGWSYPIINTIRKSLMPNAFQTTVNHNAEMTCHMQSENQGQPLPAIFKQATTLRQPQSMFKVWQHSTSGRVHMPSKKYQCKVCHKFGHFTSQCFQKKQYNQQKYRQPKVHQIQIDEPHSYIHDDSSESSSTEDSFCLQIKVQRPNKKTQQPSHITHLITNIAYKLKPHHTRNKYLWAQIDTGAEVNLMPVSIYKLIYQDNDLQKLSPCNLKIGTYTADTINIIGTTVILSHTPR